MESRGPEDSKNVKTSQAYFFEGFISFFEDFSLTIFLVLLAICSLCLLKRISTLRVYDEQKTTSKQCSKIDIVNEKMLT